MTKPLATSIQMVHNKLTNRKPIPCPVCEKYISPFTGVPVILDGRKQIIEFIHRGCCVHED